MAGLSGHLVMATVVCIVSLFLKEFALSNDEFYRMFSRRRDSEYAVILVSFWPEQLVEISATSKLVNEYQY